MIAVSCKGFMSIGITEPTDEYPFELGTCFYAGDSYKIHISEMATYDECHLMLRATCEEIGARASAAEAPVVSYKVFRIDTENPASGMVLIGETDGLSITDKEISTLKKGTYRYAVVAVYPGGEESRPEYTDAIEIGNSGIGESEFISGVTVSPNPFTDHIVVGGAETVARIEFYSLSGALLKRIDSPERIVDTSDIPAGFCVVRLTLADGRQALLKAVKSRL